MENIHTYLISSLLYATTLLHNTFFSVHRCYHSSSHTKDDLSIEIITLASMKTSLAEDTTWSSYKKNDVFITFYIFSRRGFGSIFLPYYSPCSLPLAYSHCKLYTVFPYNDSTEEKIKLGISTYTIAV